MDYKIRIINKTEYGLLKDFTYEAIFTPEGMELPPRKVLEDPLLKVYYEKFGSDDHDYGVVAEVNGCVVGACWVRIMDDYGHVDDDTPSFAISLYKEYRNYGMGTAMLHQMLDILKEKGYKQASLSCQKANYAVKMYLNAGFRIVEENEEEYIMVRGL